MDNLDGQKITSIRTLKSKFDGDCVEVVTDTGEVFRFPMNTILQMVDEFMIEKTPKRVHTHLTRAILKGTEHE